MPPPFKASLRLLALLAHLFLALALQAQEPRPQEVEFLPNPPVTINEETGDVDAPNGGQIIYGEWLLSAESIRFNQRTSEAYAESNVVFTRGELRLVADTLLYKPQEQYARIESFRAGNGRAYVDGALLEGNPDDFRFTDIKFYPGEPGTFLFEARAGELALIDQNEIQGKRLFFKVGAVPFLLIPNITQPLDAETNLFKPTLDYSGHIGASIGAEALVPVGSDFRLGGNIALTSKRGVLFGPAARYTSDSEEFDTVGSFISGYIKDQGEPGLDILGNPIDTSRYFADWSHQQIWSGNRANLSTRVRYWSDSEVTRDFQEDSFYDMQDPDSYLEANYNGDNWQLSLFTRAAINDFQFHSERLPELRFSLFPTQLYEDLSHNGFVSLSKLNRDFDGSIPDASANRLDAYYGWEFNHALRDGLSLRLKAGGRGLIYDDAELFSGFPNLNTPANPVWDLNSPLMQDYEGELAVADIGADLNMKAYSVFEYESDAWNIDGIRHIIEPRISYRYTPIVDNSGGLGNPRPSFISGAAFNDRVLPIFDTPAFSNYLPPIDIEDRIDVDSLTEDHKIRFELRNRIQTRHKDGGSRDLARLSLATDYYLKGSNIASEQYSFMHLDFSLTPAPWLETRVFARLDPERAFAAREVNTRIEIRDEGYWRFGFGSHFLQGGSNFISQFNPWGDAYYLVSPSNNPLSIYPDKLEQYFAYLEYSLNENLKVYAAARYDEVTGVFYEQRIGLLQKALERYALKYEIRFYDGDRREDDFGISIGVDLFDDRIF